MKSSTPPGGHATLRRVQSLVVAVGLAAGTVFSMAPATVAATPAPQTIAFAAVPPRLHLGDGGLSVHATATSGLPVTYSSVDDAAICTVDASTGALTLIDLGTCTIDADQAGDGTWAPAVQASAVFEVRASHVGGANKSGVRAVPFSVISDGIASSIITVTLVDDGPDWDPVAGRVVTLESSTTGPTVGTASGLTDIQGKVTFPVTSTTPGDYRVHGHRVTDTVVLNASLLVPSRPSPRPSPSPRRPPRPSAGPTPRPPPLPQASRSPSRSTHRRAPCARSAPAS